MSPSPAHPDTHPHAAPPGPPGKPGPRDLALDSLAVVLPCRNEAPVLRDVVAAALRHAQPCAESLEVIVVDDASTDATPELAAALAREDPRVRVVRTPACRGYGAALRAGFAATTAAWVFYTDGDGQFDLSELPAFLATLREPDAPHILIGRRATRAEGAMRRFNAWAWTALVNAAFDLRVRDVDCAFKVFPGDVLRAMPLESDGALISAELLARARRLGLRIAQRDVTHHPRRAGRASGASPRVILRAFRELVALRGRIRAWRPSSVPPAAPAADTPARSSSV
mgnify:CR=1 FL=1